MPETRSEGLIVRTYPTANDGLVIRCLTNNCGKLVLFAPQAKKSQKRFGRLDLFDWGKLTYREKENNMAQLIEFKSVSSFPNLRTAYEKLIISSFLAESFDQFTPEADPNSNYNYELLLAAFKALEDTQELKAILKICHQTLYQLLAISGLHPDSKLEFASAKNLMSLLDLLEHSAEKSFETTTEIGRLVDSVQA